MTDNKKAKRSSEEEIKKKLLDSMNIDEVVKFDDLNKEAEETQDPEEAAKIIKGYEDIIKTKNKRIILRFKEKEKFPKLVSELGFHKTTIIVKINLLKLCKKYPKLLKSSKGLGFLKNYHKDIKKVKKIFNVERFYLLKVSLRRKFLLQRYKQKYESLYMHSFSFKY